MRERNAAELHPAQYLLEPSYPQRKYGAPGRNRTANLCVRSATLYPIELRARTVKILYLIVITA
jgi:hypothetical protein